MQVLQSPGTALSHIAGMDGRAFNQSPATPNTFARLMSSSFNMSLSNIVGAENTYQQPLDFWDNAPAPVDNAQGVSIDPDLQEGPLEEEAAKDTEITNVAETAKVAKEDSVVPQQDTADGQQAEPQQEVPNEGQEDAPMQEGQDAPMQEGQYVEEQHENGEPEYTDNLPIVPPPDYIVKQGVRLTSTGKVSHAKKVREGHIKRPRNAFILFRSHAVLHSMIPQELGVTDHRHISRVVGSLWKNLPPEEKRIWEELAEKEKEDHKRANPNYKYKPAYRRDGAPKRRRRRPVPDADIEDEERRCEVLADVLLQGGEIDQAELEKKVEEQKTKDAIEGRQRNVKKSRSPQRGRPYEEYFYEDEEQYEDPYAVSNARRKSARRTNMVSYDEGFLEEQLYDESQYGSYEPQYEIGSMGPPQSHRGLPDPLHLGNPSFGNDPFQAATPRTMAIRQYQSQVRGRRYDQNGDSSHLLFSPSKSFFDRQSFETPPPVSNGILPLPIPSPRAFSTGDIGRHGTDLPWPIARGGEVFDSAANQGPPLGELMADSGSYAYSSLGEIAATNSIPIEGAVDQPAPIEFTYEPEQDVRYVFLSKEQAADAALVESIRMRGFGITFEMDP